MDSFLHRVAQLGRKKPFSLHDSNYLETSLERNLSTFNLFFLSLGETLGFGIFLVNGYISKEVAGPAAFISFILAGLLAFIPGACYAEFASKLPRMGSAYDYIYVTIGEFIAFLVGWNLILEFLLRAASMAQMSSYTLDQLLDNQVERFTIDTLQGGTAWKYHYIVSYPDVLAFLCVIAALTVVHFGSKLTVRIVTAFLIFKLVVVCFAVYLGIVSVGGNKGGFQAGWFPYDLKGVIAGVLPCFFAMTAFNTLGTMGEEAKNPPKSVPLSAMTYIVGSVVTYVLNAISLNLVVAKDNIKTGEAYFETFSVSGHRELQWGKYVVGIGAVCTTFSSTVVNIFCIPRILLAICRDGLFFPVVDQRTIGGRLAIRQTVMFGTVVSLVTMFIKVNAFSQFQSAGILCTYILVGVGIILLRYTPCTASIERKAKLSTDDLPELFREGVGEGEDEDEVGEVDDTMLNDGDEVSQSQEENKSDDDDYENSTTTSWIDPSELISISEYPDSREARLESELVRLLPTDDEDDSEERRSKKRPQNIGPCIPGTLKERAHDFFQPLGRFEPGAVVATCLMASIAFQVGAIVVAVNTGRSFLEKSKFWLLVQTFLFALSLMSIVPIYLHHKRKRQKKTFEVPYVPTLPLISIFIDIAFLFQLSATTWIRTLIWLAFGVMAYATYGYLHSSLNSNKNLNAGIRYDVSPHRLLFRKKKYETVKTYQQLNRSSTASME
ncbi:putative cationic amino acid transporter [Holothuria leucospilota]|uniref:Cationic amino acid transporter n=1 Tax=Holothuria leucospilota TaxID=206669 RepID=A0A9Q0YFJ8_HOLLE|nr:putative cationic amino acid transporter [Holothuria leucospilota]